MFKKLKDLKLLFDLLSWYRANKDLFLALVAHVNCLKGDVTKLKVDICEIKDKIGGEQK